MIRSSAFACCGLLGGIVCLGATGSSPAEDADLSKSMVVEVSLPKAKFRQLEPIVATVTLKNVDGEKRPLLMHASSFILADRKDRLNFVVDKVSFEKFGECPRTAIQKWRESGGVGTSSGGEGIKSGERLSGDIVLNIRSDMTRPGKYTAIFEVSFYTYGRTSSDKPVRGTARSQPITLEVEEVIQVEQK